MSQRGTVVRSPMLRAARASTLNGPPQRRPVSMAGAACRGQYRAGGLP